MIGHIAPAIDPQDVDPPSSELLLTPKQVLGVSPAAERVDVRMFEEQERWEALAGRNLACVLLLQPPGPFIIDQSEVVQLAPQPWASDPGRFPVFELIKTVVGGGLIEV